MAAKQRTNQRQGGFSLITMSIILTVAALIFASFLPGREAGDTNAKTIANEQKLEKVEEAMRSFMAFNGRRPCPADGQYAEGTANFGLEAANPGVCEVSTPAAPLGPDTSSVTCNGSGCIVGGVIPTRSLGLPDDYAYDEYGRRFTYIVDKRATQRSNCVALEGITLSSATPTGQGGLKIENTTGGTVTDNVMYAYISHGGSGYGAWPAQGAPDPAHRINSGSTDTDMQTNAGVDAHTPFGASTFTYNTTNFTNVLVQKGRVTPNFTPGDTGFDDVVWYRPDIKNTCCLGPICIPKGFRIDGTIANGHAGATYWGNGIAFADINNDGIPDLLISGTDGANNGIVYVVFGRADRNFPNPLPLNSTYLDGTRGFELINIGAGAPVFVVGDLNGDGIQDVVIMAGYGSWYDYILFGQSGGWPSTPTSIAALNNTTSPKVTWMEWDYSSYGVLPVIGDINGDGVNDLIVSKPGNWPGDLSGDIYVYFGHPTQAAITANTYPNAPANIWPSGLTTDYLTGGTASQACNSCGAGSTPAHEGFTIMSSSGWEYLGFGTSVGNFNANFNGFNGGGIQDILFGEDNSSGHAGIVWGQNSSYSWPATVDMSALAADGSQGVTFTLAYPTNFGWNTLGSDINGDGIDDAIIGAQESEEGSHGATGSVFILYGHAGSGGTLYWPSTWNGNTPTNSMSVDPFASGVGTRIDFTNFPGGGGNLFMADVTGTGKKALFSRDSESPYLINYDVVFNNAMSGTTWTANFNGNNGYGFTLPDSPATAYNDYMAGVAAGDVNADGIGDFILGSGASSPNGVSNAGSTYIIWGKSSYASYNNGNFDDSATYQGTVWTRLDGDSVNEYAGDWVATGDIDHDGKADVVISAPGNNPSGEPSGAGSVYVIFGTNASGWQGIVSGGGATLESVVNR